MYLFLLAFGALLGVAGAVLVGSGVSVQDRAFDTAIVMPGMVAIIGGFVLIGLGFALRALRRIESALSRRSPPGSTRSGETAEPLPAIDLPNEAARLGSATRAVPRSRVAAKTADVADFAAPAASTAPTAPADLDRRRFDEPVPELPPSARRLFHKSLGAVVPSHGDENSGAVDSSRTRRRSNGTAIPRMAPRLDPEVRATPPAERPRGPAFDSLWPDRPASRNATEPGRSAPGRPPQAAVAQPATGQVVPDQILPEPVRPPLPEPGAAAVNPASPVAESGKNAEPPSAVAPLAAVPDESGAAVTVLKSGSVDGMAYTLYSDGSIEAALPQGKLRFGSIAELRDHLEQSA